MGRILALDYGTKRIGVAISDESQKIAFPKPFIEAEKKDELLRLIADEGVEQVLVGLPKSLSGKETKSTEAARELAQWVKRNSALPVEFIDERFTTKEIQTEMRGFEMKSKKYRKETDSMVAQKMLERYLSKLRRTPSQSPPSFQEGEKSGGGFLPHAKGERKRG